MGCACNRNLAQSSILNDPTAFLKGFEVMLASKKQACSAILVCLKPGVATSEAKRELGKSRGRPVRLATPPGRVGERG